MIKELTKNTLAGLKNKKLKATPENYFREFKIQANKENINIEEFELFKEILHSLSNEEKNSLDKKLETFSELSQVLSNRISQDDLKKLLSTFEEILTPSIDFTIKEDVDNFVKELSDNPKDVVSRESLKKLKKLSNDRMRLDRKYLKKKTDDIIKIISLMSKHFDKTLVESEDSTGEVIKIRNELKALNISNASQREIGILQTKLVDSLYDIEKSMNSNNVLLDESREKISELHHTIEKLQEELAVEREEKSKDYLTGILNRRAYENEVIKVEKRYSLFQSHYAIIFFDLDKFKNINDTYGHDCGDHVLKNFAHLLTKITRQEDVIARYGGEEFISIINYNDENEIKKYVYRIKKIIEANSFKYGEYKIKLSFSAGAAYRDKYDTFEEARKSADKLLHEAKDTGRDKVIFDDGTQINSTLKNAI